MQSLLSNTRSKDTRSTTSWLVLSGNHFCWTVEFWSGKWQNSLLNGSFQAHEDVPILCVNPTSDSNDLCDWILSTDMWCKKFKKQTKRNDVYQNVLNQSNKFQEAIFIGWQMTMLLHFRIPNKHNSCRVIRRKNQEFRVQPSPGSRTHPKHHMSYGSQTECTYHTFASFSAQNLEDSDPHSKTPQLDWNSPEQIMERWQRWPKSLRIIW